MVTVAGLQIQVLADLIGVGCVAAHDASAFYMYATQAAAVMVDEESGRVRLLRMSAAHDVGKAINPLNCITQIEGGVAMGIVPHCTRR